MRHKDGVLTLSNGKGNAPLVLVWPWDTPQTVVIRLPRHTVRGDCDLQAGAVVWPFPCRESGQD